jgi:hypothetical protein
VTTNADAARNATVNADRAAQPEPDLSPTLAALRDALADPRPIELREALESARTLLAAHTRELADLVQQRIEQDRARSSARPDAHAHRGGMMTARTVLDRYADDLDQAADGAS